MRQTISLVLIICFVFVTVLPEKAWAWPPTNTDEIALGFTIALFLLMLPIALSVNQKVAYEGMQSGWIEASQTRRQDNYVTVIPPSVHSIARIKETTYLYSSPSEEKPIGQVYFGEKYKIEDEKSNEKSLWYKIKFEPDCLFKKN